MRRIFTLLILFIIGTSVCVSALAEQTSPSVPISESSAKSEANELVVAAVNKEKLGRLDESENLLIKAIKLNGNNKSKARALVSRLIHVYKMDGKWTDAEKVYETLGRSVFNRHFVDTEVAQILISQHQYAEARVILQNFVPGLSKPPTGGCGNPSMKYNNLKYMLLDCEKQTSKMTNKELNFIADKRVMTIKEWKTTSDFSSYPEMYRD